MRKRKNNNDEGQWYSKKMIMGIFDISESTFKRRLKEITDTDKIKFIENETGSKEMVIHLSIVTDTFRRRNKRKPEELDENGLDSRAWRNVSCQYGFKIWCNISDKLGESYVGSVDDEKIDELFHEFLTEIKNSDDEDDKEFLQYRYNDESERYDRIIKGEIIENLNHFVRVNQEELDES